MTIEAMVTERTAAIREWKEKLVKTGQDAADEIHSANLLGEKLPAGYTVVLVESGPCFISPRGVHLQEELSTYDDFQDFHKALGKKWLEKLKNFISTKTEELLTEV